MKAKKIPLRMCVGCMEHKPKKELIRIVRTPEGEIEIDLTGKLSGRGSYICPNEACLEKAVKSKKIERALECKISDEQYERLREVLKDYGQDR